MTDINTHISNTGTNPNIPPIAMVGCVPQQGADYARLVAVAPSAPCKMEARIEAGGRILRLPEVMNRVGLCRASIYQHMNQGSFPKTISLGARAVGWVESEIDAWVQERIQGRQ